MQERRSRNRIDPELLAAFETARYQVDVPEFTLKVGEKNPHIDQLLQNHRRVTWAFITPFNPGSKVISEKENEARMESLKSEVERYFIFPGTGGGQDDNSPLEQSLLILGIGIDEAKRLGRDYGQDAIVYGTLGHAAEILVLKNKK